MAENLIKRNYVGDNCFHIFLNNDTQQQVNVICSLEEYNNVINNNFSPTLEGHTWVSSIGLTPTVDTPNLLLKEGEYCEIGGQYLVYRKGYLIPKIIKVGLNDITNDTLWL